jgi:thiol:disulfide interchange protein DsbD
VDFTAAWCVSCKVNELLVFRSSEVKSALKDKNFVLMKADWTTYDPAITRALADFGRSGVPLYVIYPADRSRAPMVLPEIIDAPIVLRSLKDL